MKKTTIKQLIALMLLASIASQFNAIAYGQQTIETNKDTNITPDGAYLQSNIAHVQYITDLNNTTSIVGRTALKATNSPVTNTTFANDRVVRSIIVPATAYNSLPNQTDDTPWITANGSRTEWGVVAANFLPFGTKLRIPEVDPHTTFVVKDRMNKRYDYKIDIWFEHYHDAIEFGHRNIKVEIIEG